MTLFQGYINNWNIKIIVFVVKTTTCLVKFSLYILITYPEKIIHKCYLWLVMIIIRLLESCTSLKKTDPSVLHNSTRTAGSPALFGLDAHHSSTRTTGSPTSFGLRALHNSTGTRGSPTSFGLCALQDSTGTTGSPTSFRLSAIHNSTRTTGNPPHLASVCFTMVLEPQGHHLV